MQNRITNGDDQIDRLTSASVRSAIGDRLRQNLRPQSAGLPRHLQSLLDEMRRQDRADDVMA